MPEPQDKHIVMGEIAGVYGVRGWVRVRSFTEPMDNLLRYRLWTLDEDGSGTRAVTVLEGRSHGPGLVARLEGIEDRDAAAKLQGRKILVRRAELPQAPGEFYWADLEGLQVVTVDGVHLGQVDHLLETGANDVLVVQGERERLIPFVRPDVVKAVDLQARQLTVDWDPDF